MGVKSIWQKGLQLPDVIMIKFPKCQQDRQIIPSVKWSNIFQPYFGLNTVTGYPGPVKIVQVSQAVEMEREILAEIFFQSRSVFDNLDIHVWILPTASIFSYLFTKDNSRAESYNVAIGKLRIWKDSYVKRSC